MSYSFTRGWLWYKWNYFYCQIPIYLTSTEHNKFSVNGVEYHRIHDWYIYRTIYYSLDDWLVIIENKKTFNHVTNLRVSININNKIRSISEFIFFPKNLLPKYNINESQRYLFVSALYSQCTTHSITFIDGRRSYWKRNKL